MLIQLAMALAAQAAAGPAAAPPAAPPDTAAIGVPGPRIGEQPIRGFGK
jgi:hypothetical protein